jgi:toxin ParE1/3/4
MARLIWTEPALLDLDGVAEYIALDNPSVASRYVKSVFERVEHLRVFPHSGKHPQELHDTPYREIVIAPCRIFYRFQNDSAYILHIMRSERLLGSYLLAKRDREK